MGKMTHERRCSLMRKSSLSSILLLNTHLMSEYSLFQSFWYEITCNGQAKEINQHFVKPKLRPIIDKARLSLSVFQSQSLNCVFSKKLIPPVFNVSIRFYSIAETDMSHFDFSVLLRDTKAHTLMLYYFTSKIVWI